MTSRTASRMTSKLSGACDVQTCESALLTSCFPAAVARVPKVEFKIHGVTVDSLKRDCTNADAISTCVKKLKIDGCQEEERRQLQLLKDGLRSTRNSLCHEDLYQSMEEWNRCLNETSFEVCLNAYSDERTALEEDGRLTRDERECRYGEYACYLKSAEGCPSTSLAREAVKDFYNTNLDLNNCTRFDGSSGQQRCDAERVLGCFTTAVRHIGFPKGHDDKSQANDCRVLESVDSCTKYMEIGGCSDESKERFQYLKSDFASLRSHLCDPNLHTSMEEWNRCRNKTSFEVCNNAYNDERATLEKGGRLTRDERECRYGEYACYLKSAEGCPSTSLAREPVKDLYNTILDLNNCTRFDGSSGKQRCDAERYWECFKMAEDHIRFPKVRDKELLAEDCKVSQSVDSCTKYMEIGGCSDELKQRLQYLKSDFASLRSHLCDPNLHTSMLEWNQCLNESALESCLKLLPHDHCSIGEYNCFLNATTSCTRDSPAMKAVHHSFNTHFDLKNCSRVDWNDGNSGITSSPKILLTLAALCLSLFVLRQ